MKKKNIDNLHQTIETKILSSSSDDLDKMTDELVEWVDWLRKNKKISESEHRNLRMLIVSKTQEKAQTDTLAAPERTSLSKGKMGIILLLLFFISLATLAIFYFRNKNVPVQGSTDTKTIPFRGTLKDADGQPINSKTDVVFRLYNDQNTDKFLYEGKCIGTDGIVPDYRGEFTVVLGSDCNMVPIQESIFKNEILFLGVTVGSGDEINPRYRILSSEYSRNSAQLSGKSVGTMQNNIPYLDNTGTILLEANSPVIKATNGDFLIEGSTLSLKTSGGGEGNILLQPDAGGYTIIPSGNVGLGTFNPTAKLEVVGVEPYNAIATIRNISLEDDENTNVLSLGIGTLSKGNNAKFITFSTDVTKDDTGSEVGAIRLNNEGVSYETAGADFAEYFESDSTYPVGTIISLSGKGIEIAHTNETVVGVVSDTAGFVGNAKPNSSNSILIGLVGQVDVFVTTEQGMILAGDTIIIGKIPGFGTKGESTNKVGYALENMNRSDLSISNCPVEFRHVKDLSGNPIKCGRMKILLRPN